MDPRPKPLFGPEELAREPIAFPRLTDDETAAARSCGCVETYEAGQALITVGQRPVDCFIILRGRVDVLDTSRGGEVLIVTHEAGAILGDINAFAGRPAVATCRCTEPTEVVRLRVSDVRKLLVLSGAQARESGRWPLERAPGALETTCPGIFVAGDCRSRTTKRVAFAVGDGALAVTCVHDLLGTYA